MSGVFSCPTVQESEREGRIEGEGETPLVWFGTVDSPKSPTAHTESSVCELCVKMESTCATKQQERERYREGDRKRDIYY